MGNSQGRILAILKEREPMTQKELQDIIGIRPGSISEILAKLEDKGMILRQKDEEDKRRSILSLTGIGEGAALKMQEEDVRKEIFAALSEKERETLKLLLKKLRDSWHE